ncbi:MAG: SRPBCC family protein [Myxococcota bacterium]
MIEFRSSVSTTLSAQTVFDEIADFRNLPKWDPGIVACEALGAGDPRKLGGEYLVTTRFMGTTQRLRYRVTHWDPPKCAVMRCKTLFFQGVDSITVEEDASNGCTLTYHAQFRFPLGAIVEPFLKPVFERLGNKAIDGLKNHFKRREMDTSGAAGNKGAVAAAQ